MIVPYSCVRRRLRHSCHPAIEVGEVSVSPSPRWSEGHLAPALTLALALCLSSLQLLSNTCMRFVQSIARSSKRTNDRMVIHHINGISSNGTNGGVSSTCSGDPGGRNIIEKVAVIGAGAR